MARGSIQKRTGTNGDTSYRARVEFPADPVTGKRRQRSETFKTKRAAEGALAKWLTEVERGTALEPDKTTVRELLDRWLTEVAPLTTRETTLVGYEGTVRVHIMPMLGSFVVQRLRVEHVEHLFAIKRAEGLAPTSIKKISLRLAAALDLAVKWGLASHNVARSASVGRVTVAAPKIWEPEQGTLFLEHASTDGLTPFWSLALESGMRRGELLGLRWRDVNWARGTVHVTQEVVSLRGVPIVQAPKTPDARRTVKLSATMMSKLKQHRLRWQERQAAALEWCEPDLVFCTATGKPVNPQHVRRSFDRIIAKAGVPKITIHQMRHSHAVWLLKGGTSVKVVAERLGHKDVTTTLNVYAAALPDMQDQAIDVLDRLMRPA